MRFTWNPAKNLLNAKRHAVTFEDAVRIFDGPTVEEVDDRFDYGEVRLYAIGMVNGIELTVVYTDRENDTRHIISARRSTPRERCAFWEEITAQEN